MTDHQPPATDHPAKPRLREPFEVVYEDGRRENIFIKRLSNTDMVKWCDLGFDKSFLAFRSVERAVPSTGGDQGVGQPWFDSLSQDSAFTIVEKALALNHSLALQKKILGPALAMLASFLSTTPLSSSATVDTASKT